MTGVERHVNMMAIDVLWNSSVRSEKATIEKIDHPGSTVDGVTI